MSLLGVHLTKGQPAQSSTTYGHEMSLMGGTSDQRSPWPTVWPYVKQTWSLICGGYIWLCLTWPHTLGMALSPISLLNYIITRTKRPMIYQNTHITLNAVPWSKFKLFCIAVYDLPVKWLNIKWEKPKFVPIIPCTIVPHLGYKMSLMGGTSDQRSPWPTVWLCQADLKPHLWGVYLTVSDLTTHPGDGFKSHLPPQLHNHKNKKTNDLPKYTHYFKCCTLIEIQTLLHCSVWLTCQMAEHQMRKTKICIHNSLHNSTTLGYKMSLMGVHLTKGQPAQSSTTCGHKMSLPVGYIWPKVSVTQRSDKNINLTWSLTYRGSIWLNVETLYENLNTLCISGLASQKSFLWRTNN